MRIGQVEYYVGIRLRLLSLLDTESDVKVHDLVDEYKMFRSLVVDSNRVLLRKPRLLDLNEPENDRSSIDRKDALPIRHSCDEYLKLPPLKMMLHELATKKASVKNIL
ncbi:hypothetical protein ACTXT7_000027 [Hymenolepis weldensis]